MAVNTTTQPPLRIYFDGCEGSGKSTLARYVRDEYGIPMLDEVARTVLSVHAINDFARIRADGRTSSEFQERVFLRQLEEESRLKPPYVADRTLGNLAYARAHARNFVDLFSRVPPAYLADLRESVVFLVRPQRALRPAAAGDAGRLLPEWEGQVRIDETIGTLFKLWRVPFVGVEMASAAEREEFVDYVLSVRGFHKLTSKPTS